MEAATFRWVLIIIAVLLGVAIYFYGQHQARLRRRNNIDNATRQEIDSAFVEDEQLRDELDNLNRMLQEDELDETLEAIDISSADDEQTTPFTLPDPDVFIHAEISRRDAEQLINYHLRHEDFRLITGEEAENARRETGLQLDPQGLLEFRDERGIAFRLASLTAPGDFVGVDKLDFSTLGLNCFIDLESSENPRAAYETLLRKVDELVRSLGVKVYKPDHRLLTLSDVTAVREKLKDREHDSRNGGE